MRFSVNILLVCGVISGSVMLSTQAIADEIKGFWSRGDAADFRTSVTPNSSQNVVYHDYPMVVDKAKAFSQPATNLLPVSLSNNQATLPSQAPVQQLGPQVEGAKSPPLSTPLSREQILMKYGPPDQAQAIRAQKDSPPAMQGLFEALNSNDKELAWQYAIALAKRQVAMQETVSKATELQLMAMEAEGLKPPAQGNSETAPLDPIRAEYQPFLEKTRQEALQRSVNIDPTQLEGTDTTEAIGALNGAPAPTQRKIPVDPEGKVRLLVFFDEQAKNAIEIADSLRNVREKFGKDKNFSAVGLTKRTYSAHGLKYKGAELSFPVSLLNGEALGLDLRIQSYPTFMFLAVTTKETYRLEGIPSVDDIEKTVKAMRGGK